MSRVRSVLLLLSTAAGCALPAGEESTGTSEHELGAGSIDATFAVAAGALDYPTRLLSLPSGELFVVDGAYNAQLKRFDAGGALLSRTAPRLSSQSNFVEGWSVARLPNGSFLAGSTTHNSLFRFDADGNFDSTFGTNGLQSGALPSRRGITQGVFDGLRVLAVDPTGRILVAGARAGGAVARYSPSFSVDGAFGEEGLVIDGDALSDSVEALAPQKDGKVVVVCRNAFGKKRVVRLAFDGSIDTSFGTAGTLADPAGPPPKVLADRQTVTAYTLAEDSTIYAVGVREAAFGQMDPVINEYVPNYRSITVWRFTADGKPDSSFGNGAMVSFAIDPHETVSTKVVIDPSGRIVVAGNIHDPRQKFTNVDDVFVARLTAKGDVDQTFGNGGRSTFDLGGTREVLTDIAFETSGKLLLAGHGDSRPFVVRVLH